MDALVQHRARPGLLAVLRGAQVRWHAAVSAAFFVSRALLDGAGVRVNFDIAWMFLADPDDLKNRLLETFYYFHAYPPGANLVTGAVLKLGGTHPAMLAHAVLELMGLVLVNSFFYLCRASGLSLATAACLSLVFSLAPSSIYFEHLWLYACPIAALLCFSAALFHRALERPSFGAWLGLFATCAVIGWIRNTFHLVWLGAVIGLAVLFTPRGERRRVLAAACGPALFLVALYSKNLAVFGTFGATTFGPANLTTVTVARLPEAERDTWMNEGKLSRFASTSVYAGPGAYLRFFPSSDDPRWPRSMNLLERSSVGAPNYNHWFFLEVNRTRRSDALVCMRERPLAYAATVGDNFSHFFDPSTKWHPQDDQPVSPHHQHRSVLGWYEKVYNAVFHQLPFPSFGLYAFLPLAVGWALYRARSLVRAERRDAVARGALLCFCVFQIAFVLAASALFTFGETVRYCYDVESMIWLLGALPFSALWSYVRVSRSR